MQKSVILKLKKGSEKAFKSLFDEYHRKVYFVCRKMGLEVEDAEDVVQETFFQLWKQRQEIDEDKNIGGLIKIIAKRLVIKKIEQVKKVAEWNDTIIHQPHEEKTTEGNEHPINHALQRLIAEFPEGRKTILEMCYREGLSAKEIAKSLNISARTVENQLYRSKKMLKDRLIEQGFTSPFSWFLLIIWNCSEYF